MNNLSIDIRLNSRCSRARLTILFNTMFFAIASLSLSPIALAALTASTCSGGMYFAGGYTLSVKGASNPITHHSVKIPILNVANSNRNLSTVYGKALVNNPQLKIWLQYIETTDDGKDVVSTTYLVRQNGKDTRVRLVSGLQRSGLNVEVRRMDSIPTVAPRAILTRAPMPLADKVIRCAGATLPPIRNSSVSGGPLQSTSSIPFNFAR